MHPQAAVEHTTLDIREKGMPQNGTPQVSDKRLYVQLQVWTGCKDTAPVIQAVKTSGLEAVVYLDVNDPNGIGILTFTEDPQLLTTDARKLLSQAPFASLVRIPEMTMIGRTYSSGREADLEDWLLRKPRRNAFNPDWSWAIWYPLRRKPEFELLPKEEQGKILFEHAKIGMTYGSNDLAHDIRLACYGLDRNDNEFVLGLIGKELHALSRVVQDMRKTQQTAKYIQSLGPFFVGRAVYQSALRT